MPRLALEVIDQIDLPEIIRASTGTVASESVRVVRMQTFGADRAIARVVDKLLGRGDDEASGGTQTTAGRPAEEDPPAPRRRGRIGVSTSAEVHVVPAEARGFQGEPAGIASRVLANSVDLAITIGILFAIYGVVAAGLFLRRGSRFRFPTPTYAHAFILGSLILIVYFVLTWTANGQTYGDRLLGIRVRDHDGALARGVAGRRSARCCACCSRCCCSGRSSTRSGARSRTSSCGPRSSTTGRSGRTRPRSRAPRACRRCTVRHARTPPP